MTVKELVDSGQYMVLDGEGQVECLDSVREARERVNDLNEMGYNAHVQNLGPQLASL